MRFLKAFLITTIHTKAVRSANDEQNLDIVQKIAPKLRSSVSVVSVIRKRGTANTRQASAPVSVCA